MSVEWTLDRPGQEWKPIKSDNQYHSPAVRPKFSNYWLAYREARLLDNAGVTPVDYYCKPDSWYRPLNCNAWHAAQDR
jgi:hypothetical protein